MMQEKVGNVVLDYTYYPGEDLYSDGDVEDMLLDIAKNCKREEWNSQIAKRKSWPLLYHFSHIRENILEWLPFTEQDHVLEIGSGCGAVTGCIARKAGRVICIDLSKKRSLINAYRNREYDNIEIKVGNFQEIEKSLEDKYDYITMIGVFEYSRGYIQSEQPYHEMLRCIERHLKPDGKIVIAIENRLGLKYWAGCTEDHTGNFFEGLEGYHGDTGVRTFSRKELEDLIHEAGRFTSRFYYPYPDYKFPLCIYSDEYLPKCGELTLTAYNYDRARMELFQERRVMDTLIQNGLFPVFSNSFLVIVERGKEE